MKELECSKESTMKIIMTKVSKTHVKLFIVIF
jgi:hypothetical protein